MHTTIYVLDQEAAKAFYVETLGFEVRADHTMDGFRWLAVGPPDQPRLDLVLVEPQPPMFEPDAAAQLKAIIARGAMGCGVFGTDDCHRTFKDLSERGVTFLMEPTQRPYGIEATFRDNSGNWFSLTERSFPTTGA